MGTYYYKNGDLHIKWKPEEEIQFAARDNNLVRYWEMRNKFPNFNVSEFNEIWYAKALEQLVHNEKIVFFWRMYKYYEEIYKELDDRHTYSHMENDRILFQEMGQFLKEEWEYYNSLHFSWMEE